MRKRYKRRAVEAFTLSLIVVALSGCLQNFDLVSDESAGHLAYIGGDGNVYVTTADRQRTIQITDDATAPPENQGFSYHRLSWSPDGRLAFAAVTRSGNEARSTLYVKESLDRPARVVSQNDDHFVIYFYWAPVSCPDRPDCHRLAYLIEEEDGVGLHVVRMDANDVEDQLIATGRPFYFSWSPDGRQMLWHTGGARRHNPEAQIGLYDVDRERVQTLPQVPGSFRAPAWSPEGNHWLGVSAAGEVDQLQRLGSGQPTTLTAASNSRMTFAWSPDGSRIAFAVQEAAGDPFYGPIHVFDPRTGESSRVTDEAFRILGFFWAPDGQRISYLSRLELPDAVWMQWRVYDVAQGRDRGFAAFHPSPLMQFAVHSANQYAQSHRFWSPDGRYLVYADRGRELVDRVWLIDTRAERGTDPILIDEGSFAVWSWH